jgi:phage tail sheath protein FI
MTDFLGFHHGTRLKESSETPVLVDVAQTAVIALLGTAPDADAAKFPVNTPVLLMGDATPAADLGDTGTLKDAVDDVFDQIGAYTVIIRVEEGVDLDATLSNLVGDATQLTGVHALKKCEPDLGIKPRLIAAPGFTSGDGVTANPVVAEVIGVLEELKAVAFVDGPNTTDTDAVAYRDLINSQRVFIVDPMVKVWDTGTSDWVDRPASARVAGLTAKIDMTHGFWWSPSNKAINGIGGISRPIRYGLQTDYLNENHVATITNTGDGGFKLWGNRVATGDDLWVFLSVRRTADFINEAITEAYMEFVDKPFTPANVKLLVESGNAAMRVFKASGAIIGGRVWFDQTKNEPIEMASGKITLSVAFEPPAPMEDIRFIAHRDIEYYLDLAKDAIKAAA